jgi:uncharacterized protein
MKILIDAFNLIYKFPDLELCMYEDRLDEAKDGLLTILSNVANLQKECEFILFVDGKRVKGDYETYQEIKNGIQIYYSQDQKADDLICGYIKEFDHPNRLSLVTSDKKILQFARRFKVKCYTSEIYSEQVNLLLGEKIILDENYKPSINANSVKEWWDVFSQNQSQTK